MNRRKKNGVVCDMTKVRAEDGQGLTDRFFYITILTYVCWMKKKRKKGLPGETFLPFASDVKIQTYIIVNTAFNWFSLKLHFQLRSQLISSTKCYGKLGGKCELTLLKILIRHF